MDIDERIKAFARLGEQLSALPDDEFQTIADAARNSNPWFTTDSVREALMGIGNMLHEEDLRRWSSRYKLGQPGKRIGLVLAGNIPLVGFHDLLCVLISGNHALLKLSSKDQPLMNFVISRLILLEPRFEEAIEIREQLKNFDAIVATGSDNSARYFEYYFSKYPHVIRKNRTSIAVLNGDESEAELIALGKDVFTYFGLGCRNVSKLFVPSGYSFEPLFRSWECFSGVIHHHKYCNNYDYQKSILLVNGDAFLDNGFVILQQSDRAVSPISVLYYEHYESFSGLQERIAALAEKTQVIIGNNPYSQVMFGEAQRPKVSDYADNVDTLQFLSGL